MSQLKNLMENDKAKLDLINRMVEKSLQEKKTSEKDDFYRSNIDKSKDFSLADCIDLLLDSTTTKKDSPDDKTSAENKLPVLRSFETLDFQALTQGFEAEEVKEGTLVLYITEAQLLQLLNQRAIIVPDKTKILSSINTNNEHQRMSLVDDKIQENLGRASPVNKVELVIGNNKIADSSSEQENRVIDFEPFEVLETSIEYETNVPLVRPNFPETTLEEIIDSSRNQANLESSNVVSKISQDIASERLDGQLTYIKEDQPISQHNNFDINLNFDLKNKKKPNNHDQELKNDDSRLNDLIGKLLNPETLQKTDDQSYKIDTTVDTIIDGLAYNQTQPQHTYHSENRISEELFNAQIGSQQELSNSDATLSTIIDGSSNPQRQLHKDTTEKKIFDEFLKKTFGEDLLNEFKQGGIQDQVNNLLADLCENITENANTQDAYFKHPAIEKGRVFGNFFDPNKKSRDNLAKPEDVLDVKEKLGDLYDTALLKSGKRNLQSESLSEKNLKFLGDFVERVVNTNKSDRLFSDKLSDEGLGLIKNYVLDSLDGSFKAEKKEEEDEVTVSVSTATNSDSLGPEGRIFEAFLKNIFGPETLKELENKKMLEKSLNLIQDLIDYSIIESLKRNPELDSITERGLLFKNFFEHKQGLQRKKEATQDCFQKGLGAISKLFTDSDSVNKAVKNLDAPEKLLSVFGDFVNRVMDNNQRFLTDKESDEAISAIREYVLDCLCDEEGKANAGKSKLSKNLVSENLQSPAFSTTVIDHIQKPPVQENSEATNEIFDKFLNDIFGRESLDKIIKGNFIDYVNNKIQDLVDDSFNTASSDGTNDSILERASPFKDFAKIQNKKNDKDFPRRRVSSSNSITEVQSKLSDIVDKALNETHGGSYHGTFNGSSSDSDSAKTLMSLADFIDKANKYSNPNQLLSDPQSREVLSGGSDSAYTLRSIADFIDKANRYSNPDQLLSDPQSRDVLSGGSDSAKTLRSIADFMDNANRYSNPNHLLSDSQSREVLSSLTDFILRDMTAEASKKTSTQVSSDTRFSSSGKYDGLSYDGSNTISAQFPGSTLINFKDFDLLVPSSEHTWSGPSITDNDQINYIIPGSVTRSTESSLPDQYKFLEKPKEIKRSSEFYAGKRAEKQITEKSYQEPKKIIIKTTKNIPGKKCPPPKLHKNCKYVKKRITYSYLDNYTPSTRVYELLDFDPDSPVDTTTRDLFSMNSKTGMSMEPFDEVIRASMGKPSVEEINEYLSVINTGVDPTSSLMQIHPLLNGTSYVKHQIGMENCKETVRIESNDASYDKYYAG